MSDDEIDPLPVDVDDDDVEEYIESDSDDDIIIEDHINNNIEDINVFNKNYDNLKKNNKTSKYLSKYEITKILSKRCEQLESGCLPLIDNYEIYNNVYDIALKELKEKKIPFILKRNINNKYEYWKLEDLNL
jgi:DNA-directed RNA polymerase subunit K/omega